MVATDSFLPLETSFQARGGGGGGEDEGECIGNICLGRYSFESVCKSAAIVPCPMCRDNTVEWVDVYSPFDECMSGCIIIAAPNVETVQPRFEDHRAKIPPFNHTKKENKPDPGSPPVMGRVGKIPTV